MSSKFNDFSGPHSIGDDETGKQFKERIKNAIKEIIPNATVTTHEEAWYGWVRKMLYE